MKKPAFTLLSIATAAAIFAQRPQGAPPAASSTTTAAATATPATIFPSILMRVLP
jgi:hypothetical protein